MPETRKWWRKVNRGCEKQGVVKLYRRVTSARGCLLLTMRLWMAFSFSCKCLYLKCRFIFQKRQLASAQAETISCWFRWPEINVCKYGCLKTERTTFLLLWPSLIHMNGDILFLFLSSSQAINTKQGYLLQLVKEKPASLSPLKGSNAFLSFIFVFEDNMIERSWRRSSVFFKTL